tara:strand:+ start:10 stop:1173 length:1164 start_codon:yes stop_codon:yes gene_type:complete
MSEIKVNSIKGVGASAAAITVNNTDGTCTANLTNNLSNRNMVINGASEISQRYGTTSTSISGTGSQFPVDRFIVQTNLGSGHSHQQVADAPTGFYYSQKVTCGTGGSATGSNFGRYRTTLEWQNVIPQSGFGTSGAKQLVLSFYVKSSLTGTFGVAIQSYANNRNIVNTYTINSANTWERKTIVIAADTNSAWVATTAIHMEIGWDLGEGPDRGQDTLNTWAGGQDGYGYDSGTKFFTQSSATWQITGIQLEVDNTNSGKATDFEHRSLGQELQLCKRYYQQYVNISAVGNVPDNGSRSYSHALMFPVEMRAAPTITISNTGSSNGQVVTDAENNTYISSLLSTGVQTTNATISFYLTGDLTNYRGAYLINTASTANQTTYKITAEL